jgi:2-polyprenyl-3-methyl-5-hydroxy-6-metoxy-1,4-benzoquinol methylase
MQMEDYNTITEYLLALKPKSIFDAGFGDLKWLSWAQKHHIEFEGVEIDPALVKKGHEKFPELKGRLHEGDMTEEVLSQFKDKSCEVVLLVEVIEHIKTPELALKVLKECTRIAKERVIITTPNCGDEDMLRQHGLVYLHYTHVATDGMKFTRDKSHRHWVRFTKENLTELLTKEFVNFKVIEKRPIQILKPVCYDKLWAEIIIGENTND